MAVIALVTFQPETTDPALSGNFGCVREAESAVLEFMAATGERPLQIDLTDEDLDKIQDCLDPFETVVIVQGLPEVSGVYQSRGQQIVLDPDLPEFREVIAQSVAVFSAFADDVGQCNVAGGGARFHTKLTASINWRDGGPGYATTVDAGITGGLDANGNPDGSMATSFVAVIRDSNSNSGSETTHNYVPAFSIGAKIDVHVSPASDGTRTNQAAGRATFSSKFYNDRDFFPFTSITYEGTPVFDGDITILCGG